MADEVALPPLPSPSAGPDELRESLRSLILWAQAREPLADGDSLDKFTTNRSLVGVDLLTYSSGGTYAGVPSTGGTTYIPPDYESDYSAPTPISGLAVTAGIDFFLVEFDAPTYTQGGGNAYTDIYAANYAGTGPLPTFGSAVPVFRCMGALNIAAIPAQPGQTTHFWAGAVTRSNPATRQVDGSGPTGGTNGVSATTGVDVTSMLDVLTAAAEGGGPYSKISFRADLFYVGNSAGTYSEIPFYVATTSFTQGGLTVGPGVYMRNAFIADGTISNAMIGTAVITDAKVADLSAAKLTAGSIAVGEYIQSTGFVTGTSGWQIKGDGTAEFSGVVVRGAVYASTGTFGTMTIATGGYIRSASYTTTGFELKDDGTATFGGSATFKGNLTVGTTPAVSGTTMTGTGGVINSGGTFALGNSTTNISFNGTTLTLNGQVVATGNLAANAATFKATQMISAQALTVTSGIALPQDIELTAAATTKVAGSSIRMSVSGYMTVTFKGSGFASGTKKMLAQVVVLCRDAANAIAFTPQGGLWFREEPIHVELSSVYRIPFEKTVEYDNQAAAGAFHISLQSVYFAVSDQLGVFSAIDAVASVSVDCSATIEEVKR